MAMNLGDAVLKIKGDTKDLDKSLKGMDTKVKSSMQKMQKSMQAVGIAFTAAGAAGLAFVSSARKMNAQLGQTGLTIGATAGEMRKLALSTTNVTFPLKSVIATFDLLARAGVRDQKVLKTTAIAFDTLGDAIGMDANLVTERLIPTMKTFGLTAGELADKTDALTYLFKKTTVSLDDFNRMIGYVEPELVEMGLTTEDMIAILAELEKQGYSGEVMTRHFRKAVTLAKQEQIPLNEALGITTKTIAEYKVELGGAVGMTQEYADVANKQYGIMDKLKQRFSELSLRLGSLLTPLEPVLAAMTALGPALLGLSLILPKVTGSITALNLSIKSLLGPLGLVVLGVTALTGWMLWKSLRDKTIPTLEELRARLKAAEDTLAELTETAGESSPVINRLTKEIEKLTGQVAEMDKEATLAAGGYEAALIKMADAEKGVAEALEKVREKEEELIFARGTSQRQIEWQKKLNGELAEKLEDLEEAELSLRAAQIEGAEYLTKILEEEKKTSLTSIEEQRTAARGLYDETIRHIDSEIRNVRSAHNTKMALINEEYDAKIRTLNAEANEDIAYIQARIDAIDEEAKEENQMLKEQERVKRQTELEAAVASAETDEELARAKERLADHEARVAQERKQEERDKDKEGLRQGIENVRLALEKSIEEEKSIRDTALEEEIERQKREDFTARWFAAKRLQTTRNRLEEETKAINEEYVIRETAAAVHAANIGRLAGVPAGVPFGPPLPIPATHQGGIVTRPMIRSVAERGPEAIIPLDQAGGMMGAQSVNIVLELDGEPIYEKLVDLIRLRQRTAI